MKIKFQINCYGEHVRLMFEDSYVHVPAIKSTSFCSAYYAASFSVRILAVDSVGGTRFFNRMRKWV